MKRRYLYKQSKKRLKLDFQTNNLIKKDLAFIEFYITLDDYNHQRMIQTILQIKNQVYPFLPSHINDQNLVVQEKQTFSHVVDLIEKKNEMQKKNKLIDSHHLIKLIKIKQQDLTLHYVYEYVPYPLLTHISNYYSNKNLQIKTFIKKITYELTMIISYLAKMRIQLDLTLSNLGLTIDEKLKVYMGSKCKMGHKTQLSLIAHYGSCKQKIINHLQSQLNRPQGRPLEFPNFVIKGNKLIFPNKQLNQSIYENKNQINQSIDKSAVQSSIFDSNIYSGVQNMSTASCINPNYNDQSSKLRQTQSPRFGRQFNFSEARDHKSATKSSKNHKNSFQFGAKKGKPDKFYTQCDDDNSDTKSFTHSRSIRIQFEQKFDPNAKKQRKDSCKLKITTFHQYEMDDVNPQQIFQKVSKQNHKKDFFQQFLNKNSRQKQQQEPRLSDFFPKNKLSANPEHIHKTSASSNRNNRNNLEEKVRLAKEKAENLLTRFLNTRKTFQK